MIEPYVQVDDPIKYHFMIWEEVAHEKIKKAIRERKRNQSSC